MDERIERVKKGIEAVRRFLDPPLAPDAPPLEICAAIVDAIEAHVASAGIGKRVLPYGTVSVRVLVTRPEDGAAFAAVFDEFETRLRQRLRELRCAVPAGFTAHVDMIDSAPDAWTPGQRFAVDYVKAEQPPQAAPPRVPVVTITVLRDTTQKDVYRFQEPLILIGRTVAAVDTRGRVRRNHIAFDQRSPTVSRAHARIVFDRDRGEFRLLDEGSARGTRLVRGDSTTDVRPRQQDSRGVRLESGDEIQLGDTAIRVTIG